MTKVLQVYFFQKSCLHCDTHGSCGCLCAAALPEQINVQKNHGVIQKTVLQSAPDLACLKLACPVSKWTVHCRCRTTLLLLANNQNYPGTDIR